MRDEPSVEAVDGLTALALSDDEAGLAQQTQLVGDGRGSIPTASALEPQYP